MPWGGNQLPQWYVAPISGWWGWNPAGHRFSDVRSRIYGTVFGPGLVEKMHAFEDALTQLQALLRHPFSRSSKWQPACPPRLRRIEERPAAAKLVARLETILTEIDKTAPQQTLLDGRQLEEQYLQPIRDELDSNKASIELSFPEYWWPDHQRKVLTAIHDRQLSEADKLIASVHDRLTKEAAEVGGRLPGFKSIQEYVDFWTGRAKLNVEGWRKLLADRRKELDARLEDYAYCCAKVKEMTDGLSRPPLDWGTGRWERTHRVRATALPTEREQFGGNWLGGVYEVNGQRVAAFAASRREPCSEGEFCELSGRLQVTPCRRDRLALMIHLANVNKQAIGGHHVDYRWSDHRFVQVILDGKVVWEADVGPDRTNGEWFVVKIPPVPEDLQWLTVTLRVEDRLWTMNNYSLVLVGPIRLVELAEP